MKIIKFFKKENQVNGKKTKKQPLRFLLRYEYTPVINNGKLKHIILHNVFNHSGVAEKLWKKWQKVTAIERLQRNQIVTDNISTIYNTTYNIQITVRNVIMYNYKIILVLILI